MTWIPPKGFTPEWSMGDRLRKAREVAGMSQAQFASALEISSSTITRAEQEGEIKKTLLLAWSYQTGVDYEWLRGGAAI